MLKYAICVIGGKQYSVFPNQEFLVEWLGNSVKDIEANVLLLSEEGKIKIGKPYLKEKLTLRCLETVSGKKVRVSKFHAKANYRRLLGFRPKFTKVIFKK